jgi:hypothetical protein
MFFDSEVKIYYDLLKNDQILSQCIPLGPLINLSPVSLTPAINLCRGFLVIAGVVDTGDKFIGGDNDTGEKFSWKFQ